MQRVRLLAALLLLACVSPVGGEEPPFDLAQLRGRVVVVDFWASWCGPCRQSVPWLNAMQAKYAAQGLVVVGVNVDKERRDAERFLARTPAQFRIVFDPDGRLPTQYGVTAMPSSFVFDREGRLIEKHLGFRVAAQPEYEAILRKAIGKEVRQ